MQKILNRTISSRLTKVQQRPLSLFSQYSKSHGLSEDQLDLQELSRNFAERELKPFAGEWDRKKLFPVEALKKAASLGLGGVYVTAEYGGSEMSRLHGSIIFEELSAGCTSTTAYLTIHNMCCWMLDKFANTELKQKYLPNLTSMEDMASYCLTEPSSGSDAASLRTRAILDSSGTKYLLNGSKAFISGAGSSKVYLVMCKIEDKITCLLVDSDSPGLSFGKNEIKLGWNTQPTKAVIFENCEIPVENVVGEIGQGFKIAMQGLQGGRINIGTCSVGAAQRCFDVALEHVKDREQFGKPLAAFQNTQFKLSEMATKIHIGRTLVRQAASLLDDKSPLAQEQANLLCAAAKKTATDNGFEVCNTALQLCGGYGYLNDFPIERHFRDVRSHQILEGTNEVMSIILSRDLTS
eukprot:maker-scaffold_9-snap-gene-1.33-mRNA-1 protein AED:0.30 eAED:0.30 QI:73/1/1/1/1/1/5/14/408